jgi:carbon storage regulator
MLVLTRKIGERICIGDDVVITLVNVDGNRCRLGVDAPPKIVVRREELPADYRPRAKCEAVNH